MVENVFFYTDFFFIDHFDCMIKMFCLKDQKNPPVPVSAAAAARLLLLSFFFVIFRCGDLCSSILLFFPPSVMGEYDLRKGEKKKKRRNPLLKEIMVLTLRILLLSLFCVYRETDTHCKQREIEYHALR